MSRLPQAAAAAALMLAAASLGAAAPAPSPSKVTIGNFTFTPQVLTVRSGSTVTWVNQDDIPHTVVATDQAFRSKVMDSDGQFSFTFGKPGTYAYFCSIHPHMTGKVVVTDR
jgi:plastocyanin